MKRFLMFLGIISFLAIPAQSAFSWEMQDLNPLPYMGIGPNYTTFSMNPFKGFKNCNPCKRVEKCDRCAKIEPQQCNTCQKAYVQEVPSCGCQIRP